MSHFTRTDHSGLTPAEVSRAAGDYLFFKNFRWASALEGGTGLPAEWTHRSRQPGAGHAADCLACQGFPVDLGDHDCTCMVRELEDRLLKNITAEVAKEEQVATLKGRIEGLQKEKDELEKDVGKSRSIRDTLQAEKETLQTEVQQLEVEEAWAQMENVKLREGRDALEKDKVLLKAIAEDAKSHAGHLSGKNASLERMLKKVIAAQQCEPNALQKKLDAAEHGKNTLERVNAALKEGNHALAQKMQKLEQRTNALDGNLNAIKEAHARLDRTRDTLTRRLQECEQQLHDHQKGKETATALENEKYTLKKQAEKIMAINAALEQINNGLWQANDAIREKQKKTDSDHAQALGRRDERLQQYEGQLRQYQQNDIVHATLRSENDTLRKKLNAAEKAKDESAQRQQQQEQQLQEHTEKLRSTEAANSTLERVNTALQDGNHTLTVKVQQLERHLQDAKREVQERQQETPEEREARLIRLENEEIEELRGDVEQGKAANARKRDHLARQQERLRRLNARHSRREPQQEFTFKEMRQKGKGKK